VTLRALGPLTLASTISDLIRWCVPLDDVDRPGAARFYDQHSRAFRKRGVGPGQIGLRPSANLDQRFPWADTSAGTDGKDAEAAYAGLVPNHWHPLTSRREVHIPHTIRTRPRSRLPNPARRLSSERRVSGIPRAPLDGPAHPACPGAADHLPDLAGPRGAVLTPAALTFLVAIVAIVATTSPGARRTRILKYQRRGWQNRSLGREGTSPSELSAERREDYGDGVRDASLRVGPPTPLSLRLPTPNLTVR
jgi:hypothetical protein